MKRLVMTTGEFLLLFLALGRVVASSPRSCSRTPPSHTDCSTANDECIQLYDVNDPDTPISLLSYPPENTRTCYRTCFDESGSCKLFPSAVNSQPIRKDPRTAQYSVQRIFSPRYGRRDYRKCTNCRYNIKCSEGQLLSYSVHEFNVEGDSTCSGQQKCIDWVEVDYVNYGTTQRFCGSGEEGEVHIDGSREMRIEFVSNREQENVGFLYFVICANPSFDQNAVNLGIVQPDPRLKRSSTRCTSPSAHRRPDVTTPEEVRRLLDNHPSATQRTVSMSGFVTYSNTVIRVIDTTTESFSGITMLSVSNRLSRRIYRTNASLRFSGYGHLVIYGNRAHFYQRGVHPIFQPTEEEARLILELERGINEELGDEGYFDVEDRFDLEDSLPTLPTISLPTLITHPTRPVTLPTISLPTLRTRPTSPVTLPTIFLPTLRTRPTSPVTLPTRTLPTVITRPTSPVTLRPGTRAPTDFVFPRAVDQSQRSAAQIASQYDNACNAVLHAAASAYQQLARRRYSH